MSDPAQRAAFLHLVDGLHAARKAEIEALLRDCRHRFANAGAAVRLLQGAYLSGDLEKSAYRKILDEFGAREHVALDVDAHIRELGQVAKAVGSERLQTRLRKLDPAYRILLIDDEAETNGWRSFFQALFEERIRFADGVERGRAEVTALGNDFTLVLLDLCLPDNPEQGLKLLREIKESHFDLPVVIFSGMDEIVYAKRCLNAGASDYFVKELSGSRDAAAYYRKFREVVLNATAQRPMRSFWQNLQAMSAPPEHTDGRRLFLTIRKHLRMAYYFLTMPAEDPRLKLLTGLDQEAELSIHSHCVLECGKALEILLRKLYERRPRSEARKRAEELGFGSEEVGKPNHKLTRWLRGLRTAGILSAREELLIDFIRKQRNRAAHPNRRISAETALEVCSKFLQLAEPIFQKLLPPDERPS